MKARLAVNTATLAILKIAAPVCSLALVLGVSRSLGAGGLGRYSLAYAYLAVFGLLGPLGLPSLLTREGARRPAELGRLLSAGMVLGGAVSLALTVAMAAICRVLGYDPATTRALLVLSSAVLPSTWLAYSDAAFLALEQTPPIAVASLVEHAAKVGLGLAALLAGYGLDTVLAAAVAGRVAACAVSIVLLRRRGVRICLRTGLASLRSLAVQAPVFALSAVCATLYWRIDVFLLSHLRDVSEVGYYTAAYRILDLVILLPQSLCQAMYPQLAAGLRRAAPLWWLTLLTAPAAVVVTALASPVLRLLYGAEFLVAAPTLGILIWTAVPYAWNRYHACLLVSAGLQQADLAINASLLAVNVALNLALIPRYGPRGAAVVTLVTAICYGAAQLTYFTRRSPAECLMATAEPDEI